ncbi:MAG: hypothetical protein Q8O67_06460 [Deltaproteobacteria bacterium]|nr:hypothetical protein [Deltaproteobacteria bacterium]
MCPDCGTGVFAGMTVCKGCGLSFEGFTHELPQQKAKAAAPAPPQQQAPSQQQQQPPPQQGYQQQPPQQQYQQQQQQAPPQYQQPPQQQRGPGPSPPPPDRPGAWPRPLTMEDTDMMERGLPAHIYPLTDAEAPDVTRFAPAPLLGSALQRAAICVMAEAAVCDDPLVLVGHKPVESHVSRMVLNRRRAEAAVYDDPEELIQSRQGARSTPQPSGDVIATAGGAFNVGVAAATVPTPRGVPAPKNSGQPPRPPGIGKPLTLEEIMAIEFPVQARQPHSGAEVPDFEGVGDVANLSAVIGGKCDPLLGASRIRGSNAVMAEAAVTDDPLVLLGYPPVMSHVARLAINMKRSDTAIADDVATLLKRPPVAASHASPSAPSAAPGGAPRTSPAPAAGSGRRVDPDATALLDNSAVMAAAAAVAREQEAAAAAAEQARRRPGTNVAGRGGVRSLDDK